MQGADAGEFAGGVQTGFDFSDSGLLAMGAAAAAPSPVSMRMREGLSEWRPRSAMARGGIGPECIAGVEVAEALVIEAHPESGCFRGSRAIPARKRMNISLKSNSLPNRHSWPSTVAGKPAAGVNLQVLRLRPSEAEGAGVVEDGVGQRMVGLLLGGGGETEEMVWARI